MNNDCIFCKIAAKEIPSELVYETETLVAFPDLNPQAPVHLLIIPKKHMISILDVADEDHHILADIGVAVKKLAAQYQLDQGFRLVTNCGNDGGQSVSHLHFHLLGGRKLSWPPG